MSLLLTIIGVVIAVAFLILLSLGLFFALGIILLIVGVVVVLSLVFGGFSWDSVSSFSNSFGDKDTLKVPQAFNACLLGDELDSCRRKFTHWGPQDTALIQQLAKQVKQDLGKRDPDTSVQKFESKSVNGDRTVVLEQETDFSKKKDVREHYLITSDPDDDEYPLKIKELRWDY